MKVFVWDSHGDVSVHAMTTSEERKNLADQLYGVLVQIDPDDDPVKEGMTDEQRFQAILSRAEEIRDNWGSDMFDGRTGVKVVT